MARHLTLIVWAGNGWLLSRRGSDPRHATPRGSDQLLSEAGYNDAADNKLGEGSAALRWLACWSASPVFSFICQAATLRSLIQSGVNRTPFILNTLQRVELRFHRPEVCVARALSLNDRAAK